MTKMSKIEEILREKCFKNCRQVKICMQKGDLLGLTPIGSPEITWDDPMGLFLLSLSESWMSEEYFKLLQTSKHFQNTKTMPVWKFALNGSSPHLVFLGRVNIERSCQWASNLNDIHTRVCTLMSSHDIDIIIIKHWLVLHNTSLITSYLTGGEICCITLYNRPVST